MIIVITFNDSVISIDFNLFDCERIEINFLGSESFVLLKNDFTNVADKLFANFEINKNLSDSIYFDLSILGSNSSCLYSWSGSRFISSNIGDEFDESSFDCNSITQSVISNIPEISPSSVPEPSVIPDSSGTLILLDHVRSIDNNIQTLNITFLSLNIVVMLVLVLSILRKLLKL